MAKLRVSGGDDPDTMNYIQAQLATYSALTADEDSEASKQPQHSESAPRATQKHKKVIQNKIESLMQNLSAASAVVGSLEELATDGEYDEELEYELFGI